MKTFLLNSRTLTFISTLLFTFNVIAQNASLLILKNGKKINPSDMSINRGDKLVFQIFNNNSSIKYKITNLNLEVRTHQYQQIKSQRQAEKYHKNITLSTEFSRSPKIEIKVNNYASKYVSRFLLKFIEVVQLKDGESIKVSWITYGKEYEFWYYN